jgi:hypothetical protein
MKILIVCCHCPESQRMLDIAVKKALRELGSEAQISQIDVLPMRGESAELLQGARDIIETDDEAICSGRITPHWPGQTHAAPYAQSTLRRMVKTLVTAPHSLTARLVAACSRAPHSRQKHR